MVPLVGTSGLPTSRKAAHRLVYNYIDRGFSAARIPYPDSEVERLQCRQSVSYYDIVIISIIVLSQFILNRLSICYSLIIIGQRSYLKGVCNTFKQFSTVIA